MAQQRPASPTVRRKELANTLRRLRGQSRLTLEEAARHIEVSAATLSRIETGLRIPRARDVRDLVHLYGVSDEEKVAQIVGLVAAAKEPGWWEAYTEVDDEYAEFIGLEAAATQIDHYVSAALPVLLQTQDYSRAYLRAAGLGRHAQLSEHDIEKRIEIRQRRWENLLRPTLHYNVILDEAALLRPVGGTDVMRAQVDHIADLTRLANLTIVALPFAAGAHPGQEGAFLIVSLPEEAVPDVVYVDNLAGQIFLEAEPDLERYRRVFSRLLELSLDVDETIELIHRIARDY